MFALFQPKLRSHKTAFVVVHSQSQRLMLFAPDG